jgi:hypothetical protein
MALSFLHVNAMRLWHSVTVIVIALRSLSHVIPIPESLGREEMKKTAPMEAVGYMIIAAQEAKKENLKEMIPIRRISTIWIAAMLLVATASMSPSQLTGQATWVTPQEPPTLGEFFRIDQATGTPTPLERVEVKAVRTKRSVVEFYIEGSASPVSFKAGEPLQFAIRLMSPGDRNDGELNAKEVQRHIRLGRLVVQHFKKMGDVRMLTVGIIGLNVQPYGQLTRGLDPRKPDRVAQSFRLTPDIALTPGEYYIWIGGMHDFELDTGAHFKMRFSGHGVEHWAFEITAR